MEIYTPIARRAQLDQFRGKVIFCSDQMALVEFVDTLPLLRLGDALPLLLSEGQLESQITTESTVIQRREHGDARRYMFEFLPLKGVTPVTTKLQLDPRQWVRLRPPPTENIPVSILFGSTGETRTGTLIDVGGGGLGVFLPEEAEGELHRVEEITVQFQVPTTQVMVRHRCAIRGRGLWNHGIRLGLRFASPDASVDFEPVWACGCGELGLLSRTHGFCPHCGGEQSGRCTLPEWDDLVTAVNHHFAGSEQSCPMCGSQWGIDAHFCGRCANPLG